MIPRQLSTVENGSNKKRENEKICVYSWKREILGTKR